MLKAILLALSEIKGLENMLLNLPILNTLVYRFVAGRRLQDTIKVANFLKNEGLLTTIAYLGEHVTTTSKCETTRDEYLQLVKAIKTNGLDSYISLKLTQLGLDIDFDLCKQNLKKILQDAKLQGVFIRIDMESSSYTDRTLKIYKELCPAYPNLGLVIQSYLYRSKNDLVELLKLGANIRLCKGAYNEPKSVAFPKKSEVDKNYLTLLEMLFQANRVYPAIATHDESLIDYTCKLVNQNEIGRDHFEFQMLYGVKMSLQKRLLAENFRVRLYLPYGENWYPYLVRRLAERPQNLLFFLKNIVRK